MDYSSDGQLMSNAANFLYGEAWQDRFARELSARPSEKPAAGISLNKVAEWAEGRTRPPLWVMSALAVFVVENINDEDGRSPTLKRFLTQLNAATVKAYDEGWDGRDGLRFSLVDPQENLKDEMIISQSQGPVVIGNGITATWEVPFAKAFGSPNFIDLTIQFGGGLVIAVVAPLITEWIRGNFKERAKKIQINRKQYEFDSAELTKVIEETITYEQE